MGRSKRKSARWRRSLEDRVNGAAWRGAEPYHCGTHHVPERVGASADNLPIADEAAEGRIPTRVIVAAGMDYEYTGRRAPRRRGTEDNVKRIGMVLAIAVLAGSILAGCVIEPLGGRSGDRGYYGDRGDYGDRDYLGYRGYYSGYPGPNYHQ
jgi:hypothetical protein